MGLNVRSVLIAVPLLALALRAQPLPLSTPEAEGLSSERLQRLHDYYEKLVRDGKRAGAITLIARNGKIADWRTYGFRNLEAKLPMEKDTICRIASMTKLVTSVATLMLLEENRFHLADPVSDYLPEWKTVKTLRGGTTDAPDLVDPKSPITIKHLLTHTSGLIYGGHGAVGELYGRVKPFDAATLKEFSERAAKLPLASHPGEEFHYSISTDVLGRLVEVVAGMPFEQFVQTRIFEPLAMADTSFDPPAAKASRIATIYTTNKQGRLEATPRARYGWPSGGGGLYSTIGDYLRFSQMLLNGGELDGKRLLGRKTVELMTANHLNRMARQTTEFDDFEGFGLGVAVRQDLARGDGLGSVGAFGWAGAFTTWVRMDPAEKTVAILFMQQTPMDSRAFGDFSTLFYQSLVK
jgi:CubicO group peptidase (beta-lactamase class C family)